MDTRLEVAMIPVSDVDKAKEFYQGLGWRLDADFDFGGGVRSGATDPARIGVLGQLRHRNNTWLGARGG